MGAFYFDATSATAITKQRYTKKKIEQLVFSSATLAMIPKATDYGGANYIGAISYAPPGSVSPLDTVAFVTGGPSIYSQWTCPWFQLYGSANVTGFAIKQTKGDDNALVEIIKREGDSAYRSMGVNLGGQLWGYGGGAIAKLSAGTVGGTGPFTIGTPSQIVNLYVGMFFNLATTNGTTGSVETGTAQIASVDVNAGTFTTVANLTSTIATAANTDYIFPQSQFGLACKGIPAWIPDALNRPQVGDSFNGVNRFATDPTRLAGVYYNGNGASKEESAIQLALLINRMGGKPDHLFVNPLDYADIVRTLSTRALFTEAKAFENPQIGFPAAKVVTPAGTITLIQDTFVPAGIGWMLQLDTWLMPSMGPVPETLDEVDGITWLRQPNLNAYQMRLGAAFTTYCSAPGWNGAVNF